MKSKILYLFTRTPLHVGAGSSVGAIDKPIQRERHTGFPTIPGSSLKGVLSDGYLSDRDKGLRSPQGILLFGRQEHEVSDDVPSQSGGISLGEARLLAFPVRSAKGCFAWITSPLLLERWSRDTGEKIEFPKPNDAEIYGPEDLTLEGSIILEDHALDRKGNFAPMRALSDVISDPLWKNLSSHHLCLVGDDMMAHYASTACEIAQHVSIDDATGTAADRKLFNQENVPADTLFYSVITELRAGLLELFTPPKILQIGGDATTGLGFCTTQFVCSDTPTL
jgi:CRISPR-associated protein Cmr4